MDKDNKEIIHACSEQKHSNSTKPEKQINNFRDEYQDFCEQIKQEEIKDRLEMDRFKKELAETNKKANIEAEACINNIINDFIESSKNDDSEPSAQKRIEQAYEEIRQKSKLDPEADLSERRRYMKDMYALLKDQFLKDYKECLGWDKRYMNGD